MDVSDIGRIKGFTSLNSCHANLLWLLRNCGNVIISEETNITFCISVLSTGAPQPVGVLVLATAVLVATVDNSNKSGSRTSSYTSSNLASL